MIDTVIERHGVRWVVNTPELTQVIPPHDLDAVNARESSGASSTSRRRYVRDDKLSMPHLRANGDGAVVNVLVIAGLRPKGSSGHVTPPRRQPSNHLNRGCWPTWRTSVRINAVTPG